MHRRGQLKDDVFLRMALELSRLGTCCRLKVGCILLRPDGGIASGGYNGALPGMPHCTPETCGPGSAACTPATPRRTPWASATARWPPPTSPTSPASPAPGPWCAGGSGGWCSCAPTPASATRSGRSGSAILDHFGVQWVHLPLD